MNEFSLLAVLGSALVAAAVSPAKPNHEPATLPELRRWADHMDWTRSLSDEDLLRVANAEFTCYVVPHTHWDKEWGHSYEQHNLRLVKLVDETIRVLENNPEYRIFVLDGQASLIADYLRERPEMKDRVAALVQADRLYLGPWFTQIDMLSSSGEEIVRNLVAGIRTARELGGEMKFGYTADNFGYNGQIPQIYRGVGIERAAMYRGPSLNSTLFTWRALDGSEVTAARLVGPSGYLIFTWPFDTPEIPENVLIKSIHHIGPLSPTKNILLPAGSDAMEPNAGTPRALDRLSEECPGLKFRIGSFNEYMDAALAETPDIPLEEGILRTGGNPCTGSLSGRMWLKQANAQTYTTLENFAEPFLAIAWGTTGRRYPHTSIQRPWDALAENLGHDNMAGYAYDEVYYLARSRYYESNRLAEHLALRGAKTIVEQIDLEGKGDILNKPIVVFNSLPWSRTDVATATVPLASHGSIPAHFQDGGYTSFRVVDEDGNEAPATVMQRGAEQYDLTFIASDVPGVGYKTYRLKAVKDREPYQAVERQDVREIANEYLGLTFHDDGRFDLLDKETGTTYPGMHYFEDRHTPGYTLTFTVDDEARTTVGECAEITLVEDSPATKTVRVHWPEWRIPSQRADKDSVSMPITSYVTLRTGVKRVDIYTEADNGAYDHMIRAAFPVPAKADSFSAGVQFGADQMPVYDRSNPPRGPWSHELYPIRDWADVTDGERGLALFSRGIPAVTVYPEDEGSLMLLPIFRSTKSNGPDRRWSIPENQYASVPEPGGQLIGIQSATYSIMPHAGDWQSAEVYRRGTEAAVRLWPETIWESDHSKWQSGPYGFEPVYEFPAGDLPREVSFLTAEPSGVQLSALKQAEDGDGLVVRVYNTTPEQVDASLDFYWKAIGVESVNLLEEPDDRPMEWTAGDDGTTVTMPMGPFQIRTLRVHIEVPEPGSWPGASF